MVNKEEEENCYYFMFFAFLFAIQRHIPEM